MRVRATRDSWQTEPMGERRARLSLAFALDKTEMDIVSMGNIPQAMEDKWFIYYEDGRLHLHRSWTGYEIFEIRFEYDGRRHVARDVWVSRNPAQYLVPDNSETLESETHFLIEMFKWRFDVHIRAEEGASHAG
jgi:hypothetical protein